MVGRLFWDRVVAHIQAAEGGKPQHVPDALASLRGREMVYRREASAFTDSKEYLFKHDILREVTYESVLKRLRKKYHGLVADWLINQVAGRVGEYSGLIAWHLLQAGRMEEACTYFLQAGQNALSSYANAEAEGYFRQALELSPGDNQKAACLSGLGGALHLQGSTQEALEVYRQGIDLYLKLKDYDGAAYLYTYLARLLWIMTDYKNAWKGCQEALKILEGAQESPGMALLLAESGRLAFFQVQPADEVIALCKRAIEMADRQGELEARAEASITIALQTEDFDQSVNLLQQAVEFSKNNNLWITASRAYANLAAISLLNFQNLESVHQYNLQAVDIMFHIGSIEGLFFHLENLGDTLIDLGQLNTVEDTLAELLHRSTAPDTRVKEFFDMGSQWLSSRRGQWVKALEYSCHRLEELRETGSYQLMANMNIYQATACLERNRFTGSDDLTLAEAALRENIEIKSRSITSRFLLVTLSAYQKRFSEAREQLDEIIDDLAQPVNKPDMVSRFQAEAELARVEGRWEEAITNCQSLIDIYQAGGYRWLWARQLIDLGDCLLGRDLPGDREQAEQVYRQSLEMFTEMGATGYIKVLEERLEGKNTS